MQRLAGVIFAQGLWGIRLSHVEDLPVVIVPAFNKPTTVFNDFPLSMIQLLTQCLYFMFCHKHF